VPGTALYMMHVSAGTGVEAIAEARAKGLPIYGETLHQYLLYSAEDYKRPNGQIYHTYPSLKSAEDQKKLWHGTANDVIHCVATDELCCTLKDKTLGDRIDNTTGGNSGVEPRLAVMYTEMVARRRSGQPEAGESRVVRRLETELPDLGQVQRLYTGRKPLRPRERLGNGRAHVGSAELRQHRTVRILDQRARGTGWAQIEDVAIAMRFEAAPEVAGLVGELTFVTPVIGMNALAALSQANGSSLPAFFALDIIP